MEKFTQLGLSGKPEVKPDVSIPAPKLPATPKKSSRTGKTAAFAASSVAGCLLAVALLQTSGCSRETSKAPSSVPANQAQFNQPPVPVPASNVSALAIPAAPAVTPKKKIVKPRPATVAYADQSSGVSFRYPRKYVLKTPDAGKPDAPSADEYGMNFVQPGGSLIASVELPKNAYPGTDLVAASFNVSVNKNLTLEQCGQFTLLQLASSDDLSVQPARMKLAGMDLEEMEALSGPQNKQADAKYYHYFDNGSCYEFALGLSTQPDGSDDAVVPVDRSDVFHKLERILASVKITEMQAETPAAATADNTVAPPAAAAQDVAVK